MKQEITNYNLCILIIIIFILNAILTVFLFESQKSDENWEGSIDISSDGICVEDTCVGDIRGSIDVKGIIKTDNKVEELTDEEAYQLYLNETN